MWREFAVPWQWSDLDYRTKLKIGGGKERMASLFAEPEFRRIFPVPPDEIGQRLLLEKWHARKSTVFQELVQQGRIPPRRGVRRLAREALDRQWKVAVASTSALSSVEAMLRHTVGTETAARFSAILGGDMVAKKKPAPDIYQLAAERLGVPPHQCVAIEDSRNGLCAAIAAGMKCLVTISSYTCDEDFTEASLTVTCLGDPDEETCELLADSADVRPGSWITIDDLERLIDNR